MSISLIEPAMRAIWRTYSYSVEVNIICDIHMIRYLFKAFCNGLGPAFHIFNFKMIKKIIPSEIKNNPN